MEIHFEDRMFIYRCRLYDLYRKPIANLAILLDSNPNWRPGKYRNELWYSWIEMGFPIIKLLDYKNRISELEASSNPFSEVVLAQLTAMKKQGVEAKLASKIALTKRLYSKNWTKRDILILYKFLDWVLALPRALELQYHQTVEQIEEELQVAYITTAERIGIQKGVEQGQKEWGMITLESLLLDKFSSIPESYQQRMIQADAQTLLKWSRQVSKCRNIEEVFA